MIETRVYNLLINLRLRANPRFPTKSWFNQFYTRVEAKEIYFEGVKFGLQEGLVEGLCEGQIFSLVNRTLGEYGIDSPQYKFADEIWKLCLKYERGIKYHPEHGLVVADFNMDKLSKNDQI